MANVAVSDCSREKSKERCKSSDVHISRIERHGGSARPSLSHFTLIMVFDVIAIFAAAAVIFMFCAMLTGRLAGLHVSVLENMTHPINLAIIPEFICAFIIEARGFGVYDPVLASAYRKELSLILNAVLSAGLLLCGVLYIGSWNDIPRPLILIFIVTAAFFICLGRSLVRWRALRSNKQCMHCRNVIIVGTGHLSSAISDHLSMYWQLGYRVHGFVAPSRASAETVVPPDRVLAHLDDIRQLIKLRFIDEIVIAEECRPQEIANLIQLARDLDITLRVLLCFHGDVTAEASVEYLGIYPVKSLHSSRVRAVSVALNAWSISWCRARP